LTLYLLLSQLDDVDSSLGHIAFGFPHFVSSFDFCFTLISGHFSLSLVLLLRIYPFCDDRFLLATVPV